jgi:Cu2+-exporting ATPase
VVACPCAVGLAAPLATSLGIGRLARCGCLMRDPAALEALARTRLVAFDKTGTLTSGASRLAGIETEAAAAEEVLARAAGLERHSEHGLARAVTAAAEAKGIAPRVASDVQALPGRGIKGETGGEAVAAGNRAFMGDLGWRLSPSLAKRAETLESSAHSVIYVGWGTRVHAVLAFDDTPRSDSRATIEGLRRLGLEVALLTGDLAPAASRIGSLVGIDDVQAALSPEAKQAALDQYRQRYGMVAMVGDGLNDGPVLADADVGIAVGSATDLARETAALVLPKDGLWMLPWVIEVSRAVRRTIVTNLAWAFGYNLIAIALAALGLLQPIFAAAVMASSSLLLVANSLRLSRLPDPALPGIDRRAPGVVPGLAPANMRRSFASPALAPAIDQR